MTRRNDFVPDPGSPSALRAADVAFEQDVRRAADGGERSTAVDVQATCPGARRAGTASTALAGLQITARLDRVVLRRGRAGRDRRRQRDPERAPRRRCLPDRPAADARDASRAERAVRRRSRRAARRSPPPSGFTVCRLGTRRERPHDTARPDPRPAAAAVRGRARLGRGALLDDVAARARAVPGGPRPARPHALGSTSSTGSTTSTSSRRCSASSRCRGRPRPRSGARLLALVDARLAGAVGPPRSALRARLPRPGRPRLRVDVRPPGCRGCATGSRPTRRTPFAPGHDGIDDGAPDDGGADPPLRFVEWPRRTRRSVQLGAVPYLYRWTERNGGVFAAAPRLEIVGLPGGLTAVPIVADLTAGALIGWPASSAPAAGWSSAPPTNAPPGEGGVVAELDDEVSGRRDVSDRLFSVSSFTAGVPFTPGRRRRRAAAVRLWRRATTSCTTSTPASTTSTGSATSPSPWLPTTCARGRSTARRSTTRCSPPARWRSSRCHGWSGCRRRSRAASGATSSCTSGRPTAPSSARWPTPSPVGSPSCAPPAWSPRWSRTAFARSSVRTARVGPPVGAPATRGRRRRATASGWR